MKLNEILEKLENDYDGKFQKDAVLEAIKQKDEIIPELLKILEYARDNINNIDDGYFGHIYAIYLLAYFREQNAYSLMIDMFSNLEDIDSGIIGDIATDDLCRLLISVCSDDISLIKKLIENDKVDEYVRAAGMEALVILVALNIKSREEINEYFLSLYRNKFERKPDSLWDFLISNSLDIYPDKKIELEIKRAYDDNLVDITFNGKFSSVQKEISRGLEYTIERLKNDKRYSYIRTPVEEMEWWDCFNQDNFNNENQYDEFDDDLDDDGFYPFDRIYDNDFSSTKNKIGRNDLCPCMSGKKYKKCCGK